MAIVYCHSSNRHEIHSLEGNSNIIAGGSNIGYSSSRSKWLEVSRRLNIGLQATGAVADEVKSTEQDHRTGQAHKTGPQNRLGQVRPGRIAGSAGYIRADSVV